MLRAQVADLERQVDELRAIREKSVSEEEAARRKAEKQHLEDLGWANRRDNARLAQELAELRRIHAADETEIGKLTAELRSLRNQAPKIDASQVQRLKGENADLLAKIADLEKQVSQQRGRANGLQSALDQAQAGAVSLKNDNVKLNKDLQAARAATGAVQAQLNEANRKVDPLQAEVDRLMALIDNGLGKEFDFGRRVYACKVGGASRAGAGVAYRNSPVFSDKRTDGSGPVEPEYVIADRMVQGPQAVFIRDASGKGWLPLTSPDGQIHCFQHMGREGEANLSGLVMAKGDNKLSQESASKWFGADKYGQ